MKTVAELIQAVKPATVQEIRPVVDQVNDLHALVSTAWEKFQRRYFATIFTMHGHADAIDLTERTTRIDGAAYAYTKWTSDEGWSNPTLLEPRGFWVSIAGLCLRLAELLGEYGWPVIQLTEGDIASIRGVNWALPDLVATLHVCVGCLGIDSKGFIGLCWELDAGRTASGTIDFCLLAAEYHGVDLWAVIQEVLAYRRATTAKAGTES